MANLVYALFVIFSGFSIGCAVVGTYMSWRVYKHGARMARHAVPLLVGVTITQSVLLVRLVQTGTAVPSLAGWMYLVGLVIQSTGLLSTTAFAATRLAEYEATDNHKDGRPVNPEQGL